MIEYTITVNGKKTTINGGTISYDQVIGLSNKKGNKLEVFYSVHPRFNSGKKFIETDLVRGDTIRAQEGMSFTVADTDSAPTQRNLKPRKHD